MDTPIIDLAPLLDDLNAQLAAVEREARVTQLKLARLRGLRDGVLLALSYRPAVTEGEELSPHSGQKPTPGDHDMSLDPDHGVE